MNKSVCIRIVMACVAGLFSPTAKASLALSAFAQSVAENPVADAQSGKEGKGSQTIDYSVAIENIPFFTRNGLDFSL